MRRKSIDVDENELRAFEIEYVFEYCREQYGSDARIVGDRVEVERVGRWQRVGTVKEILVEGGWSNDPRGSTEPPTGRCATYKFRTSGD